MNPIPFVWSNDDIGPGVADHHRRQLEFLDRLGISGTFFVIPKLDDKTLDQDVELLRLIEKSRAKGHEYYQHGYIHTPFESGVPETWMLDFAPDVRAKYDADRLEIEKGHTIESLVRMIENGRRIWRKAFGEDSAGYRPGWGALCGNLYVALGLLGVTWVSSTIPCPTSWVWNQGQWSVPIQFREKVPTRPHYRGEVLELPIGGDYAFRVPAQQDKIEAMVGLAMAEMEIYHQRQDPMVIVSHWHGLEYNEGTGYAVHERLLPKLLASPNIKATQMSSLVSLAINNIK